MSHSIIKSLRPTRRTFLRTSAAAAAMLAMPSIVRAQAGKRLVFANWGGSWEQAMKKAWWEPFTKETGIQVVGATGNTLGRLQAMENAHAVEWDLVEGLPELARVGAEKGLLEKIDFSIVDRSQLMKRPEFFNDYSIPEVIFGRILTYNTKLLKTRPANWSALWDLKTFPGKRALYNHVDSGILELALLADGVPVDKLYPIDVPRALKKLGQIRNAIIWYDTVTQSEELMRSEQASMGVLADGRALNVKNSGAPVGLVPEASILTWSIFVVPKGAPNKEAAMKFLAYVLRVKSQVAIALAYNYGPVVPKAWDEIPPDRLKIISGGPSTKGKAVFLNSQWWAQNLEKTNEQFQQWMLG
ncbi:MAG TPA: ABC transporter substrate-binding protein [Alphaproteobacteria bacterium]|nr:ABC transporter substrate-binding protein [Alphaproteobacteria bacterium]